MDHFAGLDVSVKDLVSNFQSMNLPPRSPHACIRISNFRGLRHPIVECDFAS